MLCISVPQFYWRSLPSGTPLWHVLALPSLESTNVPTINNDEIIMYAWRRIDTKVLGCVCVVKHGRIQVADRLAEAEEDESDVSIRSSQAPATDDGGRLRAVKGTVLLHISFAAKQDQVRIGLDYTFACVTGAYIPSCDCDIAKKDIAKKGSRSKIRAKV